MKLKPYKWVLIIIFLAVFISRILIAVQTPLFSDDTSYFTLRQVEHIKNTGTPIINDDLSYGGRTFLFSPVFYYLLAVIFAFVPKTLALKIFLNAAASTLVFATYLISYELAKRKDTALLSSLVSGFIPLYFQKTVNTLSIFSVAMPLMFFSLYYLMKLSKNKKYSSHFIITLFFLILLTPVSIILILGLLFFLILARLEKVKVDKTYLEIIIVSSFLYVWFNFLFFKKAILFHGQRIIWQNIPKAYLLQYFSQVNILQAVYLIGILPFLLGIYAAYTYIVKYKSSQSYLYIGLGASLFFLLWFKLIALDVGLVFLGGVLSILLSLFFKVFFDYFAKSKAAKYSVLIFFGFTLLVIFTSIMPSIAIGVSSLDDSPDRNSLLAYMWLNQVSSKEDTVLASETEGHALSYFSKRKNVMDDNFLFINNVDQRLFDVRRIYITRFSQEALELSEKYSIDYIVVDLEVKRKYEIENLFYNDNTCFELVYDFDAKIYKVGCLEEAK